MSLGPVALYAMPIQMAGDGDPGIQVLSPFGENWMRLVSPESGLTHQTSTAETSTVLKREKPCKTYPQISARSAGS